MDEGKFNFGVDTLQRISRTLDRIKLVCEMPPTTFRQRLHIDEVQNYYSDAGILLAKKYGENNPIVKKYTEEVDSLKLTCKTSKGKRVEIFDKKLEIRLRQIVREVGILIGDYYMPSKDEDEDDY